MNYIEKVYFIFIVLIYIEFQSVFGHSILPPQRIDQIVELSIKNGSDEFYKIRDEFYNQESTEVYLYSDASISDLDFSLRMIRKEVRDIGFHKFKIVHDISKVPKLSTLLLFISPPLDQSTSYYNKLNSMIGYIYEYSDNEQVKNLRIFSAVYIFGKSYHFARFHNELDLFLTTQRQYKIVNHPFRYTERSHIELMVKLQSLNQNNNVSSAMMMFEKIQFPLNRYNIEVYGLPSDEQCKIERSLIVELKSWGLTSTYHIVSFQLLLSVYANRMMILQQQDFQYGPINHIFLPVSICDHFDNYDRYTLTYINTTIDPNLDEHNVILNPGHLHYTAQRGNFVPKQITQYFNDEGYKVNVFLMNYLTYPTYQLREYINKKILETFNLPYGMPKHCVSIHVRHGDKGREAKIFTFKQYYDTLVSLNTTIKDVFLMTDDESIIKDANHLSKDEGLFNFYYLNINRSSSDNNNIAHSSFDPLVPRDQYGYEILSEITIASKCEIVVCTMSSNICRYIAELQPLNDNLKNKQIKYYSLDIAYVQNLTRVP